MPLTMDQALAVESRGGARLVSAAAGSGKTRVLVERLLRYVDDGANIDEFLVITYTRAAAGELRSRIQSELNKRIAQRPNDKRLRRQTELVCRASIGTIDSLCGRFLRENAHLAGLAPDFKVVEADRAQTMKLSALDKLMDSVYETLDSHPARRALIDSVGVGRDDRRLTELILHLHEAIQSHPNPQLWVAEQRAAMAHPLTDDAGSTPWGRYILDHYAHRAAFWAKRLEGLLEEMTMPGREKLMAAYGVSLSVTAEGLRDFVRATDLGWDKAHEHRSITLPGLKAYRGDDPLALTVKAAKAACKDLCDKINEVFSAPSALRLAELETSRPAMEALLELTVTLDKAYAAEKRRQGLVDFSDQEHMVLALLEQEDNGLARSLSGRYREVLVDEYQDVNQCQDRLFTLLSNGGRKLFLVGDVKQSIYRFRLADPGIFLDKYRCFDPVDIQAPHSEEPGRILLQENFRSRPEVIDSVNHVFSNIMSRELGELDYDEDAALRPGREYPPCPGAETVMNVYALEDGESEEERPDKITLEASAIARQIRQLVDEGALVTDEEGLRPVGYGDFAILLRSHKATAGRFRTALAAEGIPSVAQQGGGFFRSLEVTVLLSLLAVIDNPRQDVPLIAVLRSPLYGFTADELSVIRARRKDTDYYTALCTAAETDSRCGQFLRELEEYRSLAPDLSVEGLLGRICTRSDLFALLSAMPDGAARRENVQVLMDYARQFELDGYRGLFEFIRWMRRLEQRGEEPRTGSVSREAAVQIMSIHHSKGLEFPIVFLANTHRKFNKMDLRSPVLIHPLLGVGSKITDTSRGLEYPSLAWQAIAAQLEQETLSEEMRVLYVAMTRARDRLYISCLWKNPEKQLQKLREGLSFPIAPTLLEQDSSMAQWLLRAALLPGSPMTLRLSSAATTAPANADSETTVPPPDMQETATRLETLLNWRYPQSWAADLPSKLTASALPREEDPEAGLLLPAAKGSPRQPDFGRANRPLTGAERGVAVHTLLQFLDFAQTNHEEAVTAEIARLLEKGHISPRQAEAIEPAKILKLFASETGQRILHAQEVWREMRFSLLSGAENWFNVPSGEEVLLQGVIDCCIREGDTITVIDYKTDYVTAETLSAKAAEYTPQIRAYAAAVSRILGLPVKECVLYFLRLDTAVKVPVLAK